MESKDLLSPYTTFKILPEQVDTNGTSGLFLSKNNLEPTLTLSSSLTDILGLIPLIDDGLKTILETDLSVIIFFSGFPSNNKL